MFDEVFGHQKNIGILTRLLERDAIPQRLCFCGPEGVGKHLIAHLMAGCLLCAENTGCGSCAHCRKMAQGVHPDYTDIRPDSGDIKVDQIRGLIEKLHFMPFEATRRVILLDQADRLREEAANAFLKALEEPPDYVTYILVCKEWQALLPTIRSRCQKMAFGQLRRQDKAAILIHRHGCHADMAEHLAGISFTSLETDPEAWDRFRANVRDVVGFLAAAFDDPPTVDYLHGRLRDKRNVDIFIEHFSQTLREILRLSLGMERQAIFADFQDAMDNLALRASSQRWRDAWERSLQLKSHRRLNLNHPIWFNDFALNALGLREEAETKLEKRLSRLRADRVSNTR